VGVVLSAMLRKDDVGNLEAAMSCTIEASCAAGIKLLRYGLADWANEGHGVRPAALHINVALDFRPLPLPLLFV
jgi:hypothetical protein